MLNPRSVLSLSSSKRTAVFFCMLLLLFLVFQQQGMPAAVMATEPHIQHMGGAFTMNGNNYNISSTYGRMSNSPGGGCINPLTGDMYFLDAYGLEPMYNFIYRIDGTTGLMTTIAGQGPRGVWGDGGLAIHAGVNKARACKVSHRGDALYYTEMEVHRIKRIDLVTGVVTTVAGTGNTFVAAVDGADPLQTSVNGPHGLFLTRDGSIYWTEVNTHLIRMLNATTGKVMIVAGVYPSACETATKSQCDGSVATAKLNTPTDVFVTENGDVYFTEEGGRGFNCWGSGAANCEMSKIRKVSNGVVSTIAGTGFKCQTFGSDRCGDDGLATAALLSKPSSLTIASNGTIYFFDKGDHRIRKITLDGKISHVVGSGTNGITYGGGCILRGEGCTTDTYKITITDGYSVFLSRDERFLVFDGMYRARQFELATNQVSGLIGNQQQLDYGEGYKAPNFYLPGNSFQFLRAADGSIVVSVLDSHEIKKILPSGHLVRMAGNVPYNPQFFGEGIAAIRSILNQPRGMTWDANGHLVFCDTNNRIVRRIHKETGLIHTIAGFVSGGIMGLGGNVDGALGTNKLNLPTGIVCLSNGDLIITDSANYNLRKLATNGQLTTLSQSSTCNSGVSCGDGSTVGSTKWQSPTVIMVDGSDNLYVVDGNVVRRIDHTTQIVTLFVGTYTTCSGVPCAAENTVATSFPLSHPSALAMLDTNHLLIADVGVHEIFKVDLVGNTVSTFMGTGTAPSSANIAIDRHRPGTSIAIQAQSMFVHNGRVYVDGMSNWMLEFDPATEIVRPFSGHIKRASSSAMSTVFYNGEEVEWSDALFQGPTSMVQTQNGDLYIGCNGAASSYRPETSMAYSRIVRVDHDSKKVRTVVGNLFNTVSTNNGTRPLETPLSTMEADFNSYQFIYPMGMQVDELNNIYYADTLSHTIRKYSPNDGQVYVIAGQGSACSNAQNNGCGHMVQAITAQLNKPSGLFLRNNKLYIADTDNQLIRMIDLSTMQISTILGSGVKCQQPADALCDHTDPTQVQLNTPMHVFVSADETKIYVSDSGNRKIRLVENGVAKVVAGKSYDGTSCYDFATCGDDMYAPNATLQRPMSLMVDDSNGALIFVDAYNVRIIETDGHLSTLAGTWYYENYAGTDTVASTKFNQPGTIIGSDGRYMMTDSKYGIVMELNFCSRYGFSACPIVCYGKESTDGTVCGGHGVCQSDNNCTCANGYSGVECSGYYCSGIHFSNSSVCSGKGTCNGPNNCTCAVGYSGVDCNNYYCYGIHYSNGSVCSGKGTCNGPNNCTCAAGYFGMECNDYYCSGIHYSNSSVCSGKGTCNGPNNCACATGYSGVDCNDYYCCGIHFSNGSVCSGKGTCNSPNNCTCAAGYFGVECNDYYCDDIHYSNSSVCSGRGICTGPNNCTCITIGYTGTICDDTSCNGMDALNSSVCNGNGQCVSYDNCVCDTGYNGTWCEVLIDNGNGGGNNNTNGTFGNYNTTTDGSNNSTTNNSTINGSTNTTITNNGTTTNGNNTNSNNNGTTNGNGNNGGNTNGGNNGTSPCLSDKDAIICSGNGNCQQSTCVCFNGFKGTYCQQFTCSQEGQYGSQCTTRFEGPFVIDDKSISFYLYGPSDHVECNKLVSKQEEQLMGANYGCGWKHLPTRHFQIILGENHQVKKDTVLHFNRLVFDNVTFTDYEAVPITEAKGDSLYVIGIVLGSVAFVGLLCCCCLIIFCICYRRRRKNKKEEEEEKEKELETQHQPITPNTNEHFKESLV